MKNYDTRYKNLNKNSKFKTILLAKIPSLLVFVLIACNQVKDFSSTLAPPLIDGFADEYEKLGVTPIGIADSVNLYFYQDDFFVWIAYTYPKGSYGTTDIDLETEKLANPLNLHVSAQIGEWPVNQPETAPQNPESDLWWNMKGWYANEVWINGMDRSGEVPRYRFKNAQAREIQLSKERFGSGKWKLRMEIRAIQLGDERVKFLFPADSSRYVLNVH